MLAVEIELLTGRYAATAHDDRRRAEWPPHPARFFSALVAALYDRDPIAPAERDALLWLERQPAPSLDVALEGDDGVGRRKILPVFVPVNDVSVASGWVDLAADLDKAEQDWAAAERRPEVGERNAALRTARKAVASADKKLAAFHAKLSVRDTRPSKVDLDAATALMPERRTRQVRTFPVVVPSRPVFAFLWPDSPDEGTRTALDALCTRVTRLGHSSSLVRCTLVEREIAPNLVPSPGGDVVLRVVSEGQLERLDREYERHQGVESRVLPARPQRYATPEEHHDEETATSGVFTDEWIVYQRRAGARLRSSRGPDLARALRAALLETAGAGDPLPESVSGHRDGQPSRAPHVAFVSCPDVGHAHAHGGVMGCAVILPANLPVEDRRTLMRLLAAWERDRGKRGVLELGGDGFPPVMVQRVDVSDRVALQPRRWCRASTRFITATPIALDRHPGNLRSNQAGAAQKASIEAQRSIADACTRIGLPRPVEVEVAFSPFLEGAQPVREYRPWPQRPGRQAHARVHARIEFDRCVRGPVLLGAGRYFGLGLCLPVPSGRGER